MIQKRREGEKWTPVRFSPPGGPTEVPIVKTPRHSARPFHHIITSVPPYQWLRFIFDPFIQYSALEEAEIIPGKDSDTRIKPLTLTNGHGRYMTVTPERTLESVGEWPLHITVIIFWPFHFWNRRTEVKPPSGFRSGFKKSVRTSRKP